MHSITMSALSAFLMGGTMIYATFPAAPVATQALEIEERLAINITESESGGLVSSEPCQAILVSSTEDVLCAKRGTITSRGIVPINMWPNQNLHESAGDCALYCEDRIGSLYKSFGISSTQTNRTTSGYECSCYDSGVGALHLAGDTSGIFYDSGYFLLEC